MGMGPRVTTPSHATTVDGRENTCYWKRRVRFHFICRRPRLPGQRTFFFGYITALPFIRRWQYWSAPWGPGGATGVYDTSSSCRDDSVAGGTGKVVSTRLSPPSKKGKSRLKHCSKPASAHACAHANSPIVVVTGSVVAVDGVVRGCCYQLAGNVHLEEG